MLQLRASPLNILVFFLLGGTDTVCSWVFRPFRQITKDYQALTRRVTSRHILLPPNSGELCISLKQKIQGSEKFIVDSFEEAAKKYSRDETTRDRGGLIGTLVPQGYCLSAELDEACFNARIGSIELLETPFGTHLLLVTERTNCPQLDGENTKLVRDGTSTRGSLVPSPQVGQVDGSFVLQQISFWMFAFFAGGVVAELLTRVS